MGLFKKGQSQIAQSLVQTIVLGGEAGEGIKSAGSILSKALLNSGFDVFLSDEYPSLVRGGHNAVMISYSPHPVYTVNKEIDILVCLDRNTFELHKNFLNKGSIVIYDREEISITDPEIQDFPCELIAVPINQILKKHKFPHIIQNTLYLAACLNIIGIKRETALKVIKEVLSKKPDLLKLNLDACEEIYKTQEEFFGVKKYVAKGNSRKAANQYFISGNEAISMGSIQGGLGFYAAYPMTPASSILDFMSKYFRSKKIIVKQTEDELSAINMAIGASFAGARSMVATSGGGFSLMVEGLGLAAITETPVTIVLSQRPGPATGLPTWTGQGDLQFALHASQDEFPRIILCPTDQAEAFEFGFRALNLAEKFQVPVIILVDKQISESFANISYKHDPKLKIDRGSMITTRALARVDDFKRYEFTANGISPRSIPGQPGGIHIANSDESDEKGFSEESSENRIKRVHKRFKKTELFLKEMPSLNVYGDIRAKTCIITWGSSKGAALEAVRRLQNSGMSIKLLALNYVSPFPTEELLTFLNHSRKVVLVESNYTSQLGQLIKLNTGFVIKNSVLKFDGRPIYPDEIVDKIVEIES